jgi:hypothetical protein
MPSALWLVVLAAAAAGERPAQANAAFGRAQAAIGEQRCDRALPLLREAIQADPAFWEAHKAAADCQLALKKPEEALVHAQRWAELRPDDAAAQAALAKARAEVERAKARPPAPGPAGVKTAAPASSPKAVALGDIARARGNPKSTEKGRVYTLDSTGGGYEAPPIPDDAPGTLLDAMERRAEAVFRPRMEQAASSVRQLRTMHRRYFDACYEKTTTRESRVGNDEVTWYRSESTWVEQWRSVTTVRNEELPECRALASDINALTDEIADALDGADAELSRPPAVYPGIRERVFVRLAREIW